MITSEKASYTKVTLSGKGGKDSFLVENRTTEEVKSAIAEKFGKKDCEAPVAAVAKRRGRKPKVDSAPALAAA